MLDDFGAGYASIGYLKELHFDQIKLDGGLVTAAQDNAASSTSDFARRSESRRWPSTSRMSNN